MEMYYEEFLKQVTEDLQYRLPGAQFGIQDVNKLQGESYQGISVAKAGSDVRAMMNLESDFEALRNGAIYADVLDGIGERVVDVLRQMPEISAEELRDPDSFPERLSLALVPMKGNEEMLDQIPYRQMEDLALYVRMEAGENASAVVTNQILKDMGMTKDELFDLALAGAPQLHPVSMRPMSELLGVMDMGSPELMVATTDDAIRGAAVIAYPGFLEEAAARLEGNFYILPSSIHEVLLMPENMAPSVKEMEEMVWSINRSEVDEKDRLSDRVYHFDSKERAFELAANFEKRMQEKAAYKAAKKGLDKLKEKKAEAALQPKHPSGRGKETIVL